MSKCVTSTLNHHLPTRAHPPHLCRLTEYSKPGNKHLEGNLDSCHPLHPTGNTVCLDSAPLTCHLYRPLFDLLHLTTTACQMHLVRDIHLPTGVALHFPLY